jgi:oligopeptide transport system permease protein
MRKRGLWRDAWQRLWRNRAAVVSLIVLAVLAMAALVGPALSPHAYDALDWRALAVPPGEGTHWLGTDRLGRDLLVRTLHGTRISIAIALLATAVSVFIGVAWGAVAGYVGGRLDALMMRIVDALYSLPYIFFVIVLTVLFGRSVVLLFIAIGAVGWLTMARIVRGQVLSLKHQTFVEAARALGASDAAIIFRHIVPNTLGPVIVYTTLTVPAVILQEAFLSFLGLGVQPPNASWGTLVSDGARLLALFPWLVTFPSIAMSLTLLAFNFLGDGLRDALDPQGRKEAGA